MGTKPVKVSDGQNLHVCIKISSVAPGGNDCRRHNYGYSGYKDRYSVIEGQEYDFDMDYSSHNDNSTSSDWGQIPYILYSK